MGKRKNRLYAYFSSMLLFFFSLGCDPTLIEESERKVLILSGRLTVYEEVQDGEPVESFIPALWTAQDRKILERIKKNPFTGEIPPYYSAEVHETAISKEGTFLSVGVAGVSPVLWISGKVKHFFRNYRCDFRQYISFNDQNEFLFGPWRKIASPDEPTIFAFYKNDSVFEFSLPDAGTVSKIIFSDNQVIASVFTLNQSYFFNVDTKEKIKMEADVNILNFEKGKVDWNYYGFWDKDDDFLTEDSVGVAYVDGFRYMLQPDSTSFYCTSSFEKSEEALAHYFVGISFFRFNGIRSGYYQDCKEKSIINRSVYKHKGVALPIGKKLNNHFYSVGNETGKNVFSPSFYFDGFKKISYFNKEIYHSHVNNIESVNSVELMQPWKNCYSDPDFPSP